MNFAYIKINEPEEIIRAQKQAISAYARLNSLNIEDFLLASDFSCAESLPPHSTIIVSEIIRLGQTVGEIKNNLEQLLPQHKIISAAENLTCDFSAADFPFIMQGINIALSLQKNVTSYSTRRKLSALKASGVKLGHPVGKKLKSKLAHHKAEIKKLLADGISKAEIARRLNLSRASIYNFLKNYHN